MKTKLGDKTSQFESDVSEKGDLESCFNDIFKLENQLDTETPTNNTDKQYISQKCEDDDDELMTDEHQNSENFERGETNKQWASSASYQHMIS